MKKLNHSFLNGFNWLLAGMLGLLGFSAVSLTSCMYGDPYVEYGASHTDYVIKGKVVDKATRQAIPGLKVKLTYKMPSNILMYGPPMPIIEPSFENAIHYPKDSVFTDEQGKFRFDGNSVYGMDSIGKVVQPLIVFDVDGIENGSYYETIETVKFEDAQQTKADKGWYKGEYTKDVEIEMVQNPYVNE